MSEISSHQLIDIPVALQPYVRRVSLIDASVANASSESFSVFADGSPGILFHASDAGFILNGKEKISPLLLYGQTVEPIRLSCPVAGDVIVVSLHPHVVPELFDVVARVIADDCVDLDLLPSIPRFSLREQLFDAPATEDRLSLLFRYLISLVNRGRRSGGESLQYAVRRIRDTNGMIPLRTLRSEMNTTERTFERRFEQYVGISPKLFSRIIQFQHSLSRLRRGAFARLSDIAYDSGYADQSHFTRQFKQFTGIAPLEFLRTKSTALQLL